MKIERIDERTVKCFLSNEELEEYDISYRDFILRSDKAREVVEDIIEQAEEEVGYQPPRFAFDLQIMMLPDQGMVLTFSDRGPESDSPEKELADRLKSMKDYITSGGKPMFLGGANKLNELVNSLMKLSGSGRGSEGGSDAEEAKKKQAAADQNPGGQNPEGQTPEESDKKPSFAVFYFPDMRSVCQYARALPGNLNIESSLYGMDGKYYLFLEKGGASYEVYSRACIQAMEFAFIFSADRQQMIYLEEHGECIIIAGAIEKLKF